MPIYVYQCCVCEHEFEEFQHIHDEPIHDCPKSKSEADHFMPETVNRIPTATHTDMKEFNKPIEMHSLGLAHPDELAAFRQRNPDVTISSDEQDPLYGVPIAHTRKEKLDILKVEGWEEKERRK